MNIGMSRNLDQLKATLPQLAEEARNRAGEFEEARQISPDFAAKLKAAGIFHMLASVEQGGLGANLADWFDMAVTMAEADASTGWVCAHGAAASSLIANVADQKFALEFLADPNAAAAWSNLPRVKAERVEGGMRISGSWGFVTGCTAASYVGGMFPLPKENDDDPFRLVTALVPIEEAAINQTWDPVGLAGTGSHDVVFDDVFVPWVRIFDWPDSHSTFANAMAVIAGTNWIIGSGAAATYLGLARRAIDEVRGDLTGKKDRRDHEPMLAKQDIMQVLEVSEGQLYACRAGMEKAHGEAWKCGSRGEDMSVDLRLNVRLAAVTAVYQCTDIVRAVFDIAGASALGRNGVMQRLYRDASCLKQHLSTNRSVFQYIGKVRCGFEPISFMI